MGIFDVFKKKLKRDRIGLVLGGGGARGFVQIGALKAFYEKSIDFDMCVGTSVGSIVGALYCAGLEPDELERVADKIDVADFHGKILFKSDDPRKIGAVVRNLIGDAKIEDLPKKFAAVATDLKTGKRVVLDSGSVADAVSASSAYPIVYSPINIGGQNLVDGGLVDNIPSDVCRMLGAKKTVVVDVNSARCSGTDSLALFDVLKAVFSIMSANSSTSGLMDADLVIAPDTAAFSATSKLGYREMIEIGYSAALEVCDKIKAMFEETPSAT